MDADPGWTTQGLWAWGQPTGGGGGAYGNPDPASGATGSNAYGYNLSGDYQNSLPETHLTSNPIDCTGLSNVTVNFWRWLNVEDPSYDHAHIDVSNNGSDWTTVWQNTAETTDSAWTQVGYDISSVADGQSTVYLRWTMGTTDSDWQYSGWNIDDVEIWAVRPASEVQYSWNMDADPGWTTQGLWAWGQPTGGGGAYGNPDPASGYNGSNVYGYNLSGDYQNSLSETYLTSNPIDCTGLSNVTVNFWRWLNVEDPSYDHAYIDVSNNGSDWTTVWQNTAETTDSAWTQVGFDISSVADGESTVYLRWAMGTTDSDWQYAGWNIDNVEIRAVPEPHPLLALTSGVVLLMLLNRRCRRLEAQ
jgi:hypothetical protein